MTRKDHHTVAWVLFGLAVLIIIWLLMRKRGVPGSATYTLPGFTIPGFNLSVGNPVGPATVDYNLPPLPNYSFVGSCSCGCTDGPTVITPPDYGQAGADASAAIANATVQNYLSMFGYPIQVLATDRTPVSWNVH